MHRTNKNKLEDRSDFGIENEFDFDEYGYYNPHRELTKSQKISVGVLAFFALFLIIFQFAKFKNNLNKPFEYKENNSVVNKSASCSGPDCPETVASLKARDTDGDGLNDYDELNIYKTSPYLEDSDSDGFSDFEEIKNEKDPNCPSGRDCYETDPLANAQAENKSNINLEELQKTYKQNGDNGSVEKNMEISNLDIDDLGNIDADTLRSLLLESGVEKQVLDQINDEDLLSTFQEVLGSEQ